MHLQVPSFDTDLGVATGLVLVDRQKTDDVYFPEEMFYNSHDLTTFPSPASAVIAEARSPVFWLLMYVGTTQVHYAPFLLKKWDELLSSRKVAEDALLLGGTPRLFKKVGLDFNYKRAMQLYCSWYANLLGPGRFAHFAPFPSTSGRPELEAELARTLPPFPAIEGVWFVGQPLQIASSFMTPLCVGCDAATDLTIRCKTCKQQYCGHACFQSNWRKACGDCVKANEAPTNLFI